MKQALSSDNTVVLRLDSGEEVRKFALENKTTYALISGLGSSKEAELGYYDLDSKEYRKKTYSARLEVVSLAGNIALLNGELAVHMHGPFSTDEYAVLGGHVHRLIRLITNPTMEIAITVLQGEMHRKPDSSTGLNLLD